MVPDQRTRVIQPVGMEQVCRTGALSVEIRRVIRCPIHAKGQQVARIQLVIQPPIILGRGYCCGIRELDQFKVGNGAALPGMFWLPPPAACAPSPKTPGARRSNSKGSRPRDGRFCTSLVESVLLICPVSVSMPDAISAVTVTACVTSPISK